MRRAFLERASRGVQQAKAAGKDTLVRAEGVYVYVCVRVCVCVRSRARVCVCV